VDLEEWRVRMERVKRGSAVKAERMEGPRLPPAPIRIMFLRGEDIFEDITEAMELRIGNGEGLNTTVSHCYGTCNYGVELRSDMQRPFERPLKVRYCPDCSALGHELLRVSEDYQA